LIFNNILINYTLNIEFKYNLLFFINYQLDLVTPGNKHW